MSYFGYISDWQTSGHITYAKESKTISFELGSEGSLLPKTVGAIHFEIKRRPAELELFWIAGYSGGLFLPFRDQTNSQSTYGGDLCLFDTINGAD